LLIDVREDREWQSGHLPNAVHIGKGVIERDIETAVTDKNTTIVLYCGGGFRSALAGDMLQLMGYSDVLSLAGGYTAWVNAGLPLVKPE
jgi:rhodanese-related sulfurtransferase